MWLSDLVELPESACARRIIKAFLHDDFNMIIVHGNLRSGKSVFSIKVLGEVYKYLYGDKLSWKLIRKNMGWDPSEVSEQWLDIDGERIPMYIWDDAGYWLFSLDWNDPLLISIQKYMNVIGTDMNTLVLTTPDPTWILSKMAKFPELLRIKIFKRDGGMYSYDNKRSIDSKTRLYSRRAQAYRPWVSPDLKKHGVNKIFKDDYSCFLKQDLYEKYQPVRLEYARQAKLEIREQLRIRNKLRSVEKLKLEKRYRKLREEEKRIQRDLNKEMQKEAGLTPLTA